MSIHWKTGQVGTNKTVKKNEINNNNSTKIEKKNNTKNLFSSCPLIVYH